jgi:hypothetical protein
MTMNGKNAIAILICALICAGCSSDDPWESPSIGLISSNDASLYYITPQNDVGIVFFRAGRLNSSDSNTSDPEARTFHYSGTLTAENDEVQVEYRFNSSNVMEIAISGAVYNLAQGAVFLITEQGSVEQLPFNPLPPSKEYGDLLRDYLRTNKSNSGAGG